MRCRIGTRNTHPLTRSCEVLPERWCGSGGPAPHENVVREFQLITSEKLSELPLGGLRQWAETVGRAPEVRSHCGSIHDAVPAGVVSDARFQSQWRSHRPGDSPPSAAAVRAGLSGVFCPGLLSKLLSNGAAIPHNVSVPPGVSYSDIGARTRIRTRDQLIKSLVNPRPLPSASVRAYSELTVVGSLSSAACC